MSLLTTAKVSCEAYVYLSMSQENGANELPTISQWLPLFPHLLLRSCLQPITSTLFILYLSLMRTMKEPGGPRVMLTLVTPWNILSSVPILVSPTAIS